MKKYSIIIAVLIFSISCSYNMPEQSSLGIMSRGDINYEESAKMVSEEEYVDDETENTLVENRDIEQVKIPEKIIKTGNVSIEVDDYNISIEKIKQSIKSFGAYISNETEDNSSYAVSNRLTIRVTTSKFDNLMDTLISGAKKVSQKNISLKDVSEEFVDIQARLKAKKEVEGRYYEILKKANSIRDILEVENQIKQIREEIDAIEGRLKYLNDQVSFSTIYLNVNQYYEYDYSEPGFFSKIENALEAGWDGLKIFIIGIFYLWPMWLILGGILFLILKLVKRSKKKKE